MAAILIIMLFTAAAMYAVWAYVITPMTGRNTLKGGRKTRGVQKEQTNYIYIIAAMTAALLLRLIISAAYRGHSSDMSCFEGWSDKVFSVGIPNFYTSEGFHDYPPGYMYVLYVIGALRKAFHPSGGALYALVKLPAALCDIAIGFIIYKIARKRFSDKLSTIIAALYLFNPVPILNGSIWGQVDSVYTLLAVAMIYFITEKKMIYSYFAFALCLLIKPQAFIFSPVLIGGIVQNVFLEDFSREKFIKNLAFGILAILTMLLLALPFGIVNVFEQYRATIASYPHPTVNAFNLWGAIGLNWRSLPAIFQIAGNVFLFAAAAYAVYLILKSKNEGKYYFAGAFMSFIVYIFSVRMHERYAFPAVALLIAALVYMKDIRTFTALIYVTLSQFFNTAWVLFIYENSADKSAEAFGSLFVLYSVINTLLSVYILFVAHRMYVHDGVKPPAAQPVQEPKKPTRVARKDIIIMAAITLVYSCIALYDLGDMHAANSEYTVGETVRLDLGSEKYVDKLTYYLGSYELNNARSLNVKGLLSNGSESFTKNITKGSVYRWNEETVGASVRYIELSSTSDTLYIEEFALIDKNGNTINYTVTSADKAAAALNDEQSEVPERQNFRNSTYFDEIYHARTAFEFISGRPVYETTHPPLGKSIIALGIRAFGMNPFGWRISGTIFGIMMVPVMYLFALRMFRKTWLATVTCLIFTFDFMHFAQTRIATIDVYITFFIILMFYFMYRYCTLDFYDERSFRKGLLMLALCGTCTGFGIATKMTGAYAIIGLFVIMVIMLTVHIVEHVNAQTDKNGTTNGIRNKLINENFTKHVTITIIWSVVFFIIVPLLIYALAYMPFVNSTTGGKSVSLGEYINIIIDNFKYMSWYHGEYVPTLDAHAYSSSWYDWFTMRRPIWYFSGTVSDGVKEGISSFGNPLVWWAGIPAFFYMIYRAVSRIIKEKKWDYIAVFLIIAYLAQLLPWVFVTRMTFIYHYFPSVPFVVLMIGYSLKCIYDNARNKRLTMYAIFGYTALVIVMFAMFYPVLSGQPVSVEYVKQYLKWFEESGKWVLI